MMYMQKIEQAVPCLGYSLSADWYEANSNETLLVLSGYQSTKERQIELVSELATRAGVNALVLDYSGHGKSPFELSETRPAQHLLETICAFDWLSRERPKQTIDVMGTSYGGFQAAFLTRFRQFNRLILRTPAIYRPEDMYTLSGDIDRQEAATVFRKDREALQSHPLFQQPVVFNGDTLVIVHSEDEDVPPATTDVFVEAFSADTYTAEGFRHAIRDPRNPENALEDYYAALGEWLKKTAHN
jgi:predicted alpha/beta hydrolase